MEASYSSRRRQGEHRELPTKLNEGAPLPKRAVELELTNIKMAVTENVIKKGARSNTSARRGSCMRRSYTIDFKVKTLRLLDKFSMMKNMTNKWEKVASSRGI